MRKNGIHYKLIENNFSNENLVFVHGSGCNSNFLDPLAQALSEYNCYLIDLPDHGESENRNCMNVEDYIDAVAEFVSDMTNVTLVGHSLGGTICVGVAARSIPSVKRSVIISSGAKYDKMDRRIHNMVEKNRVDWPYIMKCLGSFHSLTVLKAFTTFEPSDILLKDFDIDLRLDILHVLPAIKIPILIMVGSTDILTIPEYSYLLKDGIKKSKLVIVPKCRHMLPLAKKKEVSYMIRRFVEKT